MSRDVEFGRKMKRQKIERWRRALSDYGYPFEIVPGYEAMAALEAAQLTSAKRDVTPIIVPPGNWNSKAIDPGTRCRTAAGELAQDPPSAESGRAHLERELQRWHGESLYDGRIVDMEIFERLPAAIAQPQEANPWLLTDYEYPGMDRVMWDNVAIVEVPTAHHWEVPVYLDWGNWNAVPKSTTLAAVACYWEQRYGARLIAVGNDQLEFSIERKPKTFREAAHVFREHFLFGPDPVELKETVLAQYAADLMLADTWVFWWD